MNTPQRPLRVAVVCDFAEDRWHSMDLVADMLLHQLQTNFADRVEAVRVRPAMKFRFAPLAAAGRKADQLTNRFLDYPVQLERIRRDFDLFHVIDHSYAHLIHHLPPGRTLLTCHDLDAFRCLLEPERDPRPPLFRAMTRRILSGFRKAAHICCDTGAIRDEVVQRRLADPARLGVIPLGADELFSTGPDPGADAEAARLLGPPDPSRIDILHVGSTAPRKRIELLLEIFAKVRDARPGVRLIRCGGPFNGAQAALAKRLGLAGAIHVMPFLERSVLAAIYRRATLAVLPSSAEGFGLPVVEAMASGSPIVVSDLPVLREVGGEAAFYAPGSDAGNWSRSILELLSKRDRPDQWDRIRRDSVRQAELFRWRPHTQRVVEEYHRLTQYDNLEHGPVKSGPHTKQGKQ